MNELGNNVKVEVRGNTLTITVDLSQDMGPSQSGKTILVASTQGNKKLPGKEKFTLGLYVYKKPGLYVYKEQENI